MHDGAIRKFTGQDSQQQSVRFDGLESESEYRWELTKGPTQTLTRSGHFTIFSTDGSRSFAVVGHTHGTEHLGHYPDQVLASSIASSRPQFLIHTGDCVYLSTHKGWKKAFFQIFRPVLEHSPIYIAPGNHDSGWPFIDGMDLRTFQELFPHPYPEDILGTPGAANYDKVQGSINFLYISYVTDLAKGTPQYDWIKNTLRSSTSEFNIVVLGGANNYFAKQDLETLLNGDGSRGAALHSQPAQHPIFTLGTANQEPHPWLSVKATAEHIAFREMDAAGKAFKTHWIHSKRERNRIVTLTDPTRTDRKTELMLRYKLPPPIPSADVTGLRFKAEGLSDGELICYMMAKPKSKLSKGEPGFRSEYSNIAAKDGMAAMPIPSVRPMRGGSYEITKIILKLSGAQRHPNLRITDAWLY